LKLKCDEPLSNVAFKFNVRRYTEGRAKVAAGEAAAAAAEAADKLRTSEERNTEVGRCRLTVSTPELKARLVSALETEM
jgi:hypothetical protein